MSKRSLAIGLCFLLICSLVIPLSLGLYVKNLDVGQLSFSCGDYIPHEPIYINGNDDFIIGQNGITFGEGTPDNPYLINDWKINASTADGIYIKNSDVYFIIENCYIHEGEFNYSGIVFKDVINGRINSTYSNKNKNGIFLEGNCQHITISNSSLNYNKFGIIIGGSFINIFNNSISYSVLDGIVLSSDDSVIEGNIISYNGHDGIDGNEANNNTYVNNSIFSSYRGILLSKSYGSTIISNTISLNSDSGIFLHSSYNNNITVNSIFENGQGIEFTYSHNNYILNNNITANKLYNIWFYGWSNTNIISYNVISSSYIGIFYPEAQYNKILHNNINNNKRNALFQSVPNTWDSNYWDRSRLFPKIIFGTILFIPWFNIDWHPAKEPYDIGG